MPFNSAAPFDIPGVEEEGIIEPWAWVEAIEVFLDDEGTRLLKWKCWAASVGSCLRSIDHELFTSGVQAKAPAQGESRRQAAYPRGWGGQSVV